MGYDTVTSTADPIMALEFFKQGIRSSLILTDLQMPEMLGLEFAAEIRKFNEKSKSF